MNEPCRLCLGTGKKRVSTGGKGYVRQNCNGCEGTGVVYGAHKPLNLPTDRSKMIEKAINADDGACSTGTFAESDEAEYWSLRAALATIAHENLNTIGLSDSEKVTAFKKLALDALGSTKTPCCGKGEHQ